MLTVFVGDCTQYTADCATAHDSKAFLVDHGNWRKVLKANNATIYTSLADLPKIDEHTHALWQILQVADHIYYVPPAVWSDSGHDFTWSDERTMTEFYLYQCTRIGKTVMGLDLKHYQKNDYLSLVASRQNDQRNLWIAGCSIAHGMGVAPQERFGWLIGQTLKRNPNFLTKVSSSLEWQSDQILRSDITKDDIVIWGLTSEKRAPRARRGNVIAWPDSTIEDVEYRLDETRYYKAITSVFQVINFCNKIGCELILLPFICTENLQMHLIHESVFYTPPYQANFLDFGTDGIHPGPKQHQYWADFCKTILVKP